MKRSRTKKLATEGFRDNPAAERRTGFITFSIRLRLVVVRCALIEKYYVIFNKRANV